MDNSIQLNKNPFLNCSKEKLSLGAWMLSSSNPNQAQGETKIITEPQYMPLVPEVYRTECLIVGNKESLKSCDGIKLSRPLTEQKIETAIAALLAY